MCRRVNIFSCGKAQKKTGAMPVFYEPIGKLQETAYAFLLRYAANANAKAPKSAAHVEGSGIAFTQ